MIPQSDMKAGIDDGAYMILAHFGAEKQMSMVVGEIGELLTLWGRHSQGRAMREDWINELADTQIMLLQLRLMLEITEEELDLKICSKINRTLQRIEEGYYDLRT